MDRLPLVPQNEQDHDVLPILTEVLQDVFRAGKYPVNVAENYQKYRVDTDYNSLQATGVATIKILQALETRRNDMTGVEEEIMQSHASAVIAKDANVPYLEVLQLKRYALFKKLSNHAVETYKLIQAADLFPNRIEQFLDFTFNPYLHTCEQPCPRPEKVPPVQPKKIRKKRVKPEVAKVTAPFKLEPDKIIFYNYEPGQVYKEKFKLRNITPIPQNFSYWDFPKESHFCVRMLSDSCRLAPGMSAEFLVVFQPLEYKNCKEFIKFKTIKDVDLSVCVVNSRDPPKLTCYITNPLLPPGAVSRPNPGCKAFSQRRRSALNFTVDCGTCLLGGYSLITVIMKNEGQRGRFLLATENEWLYSELNESSTRPLEITQGPFAVFPVFFEMDQEEICQIFISFVPDKAEFFNEKLFVICDNNAHQEVELLGDCLAFDTKFLKVNMFVLENTFSYSNRVVSITLAPHQTSGFVFSVINSSPIHFTYYWALSTSNKDPEDRKKMNPDWIKILYGTRYLPSFSTTDVIIQLTPESEEPGSYYIYINLYLKNVPTESLPCDNPLENEDEVHSESSSKGDSESDPKGDSESDPKQVSEGVSEGGSEGGSEQVPEEISEECLFSCAPENVERYMPYNTCKLTDVHIFELGIFCDVVIPDKIPALVVTTVSVSVQEKIERQSLMLSRNIMHFGVIPKGVLLSQSLYIKNLTDDEIQWKLIEIHCNDKTNICFEAETSSLSRSSGIIRKKQKRKIVYSIETKNCVRWVSILVLFSCPTCTCQDFVMESVCLVAYEVADIKISIRTENNTAVLCPKEFIYIGIPSFHTIYIHNSGILTGCFYFLKSTGSEADKLRIRLKPQSGVVAPGVTIEVKVELLASEDGVFDDIHIPCFIGNPDKPIFLSILCTVATINVHFYLPNPSCEYSRILWPPKGDQPAWDCTMWNGEDCFRLTDAGEWVPETPDPLSAIDKSLLSLIVSDSIAATYPTIKAKIVRVKKATKLTFYIENLTPMVGHFTVEATNYSPENDCVNHILVKAKARPPEFYWDKACLDGYGIVIEPGRHFGDIVPYEVVEIDLWIYANTWGKYLEEIIIEINDLTPFCFNLLIEVVGLPIEFPFARNTTLPCPTLRFENLGYSSKQSKNITVTNISAIPIQINWYLFTPLHDHAAFKAPFNFLLELKEDGLNLVIPKTFYGCEACRKCVNVSPCYFVLEKQATVTLQVNVAGTGFISSYYDKTHLKHKLMGFIGVREADQFKESYFKRESGFEHQPVKIEVLVTLELPIMEIDVSSDETNIDIFVNDVLLLKDFKYPEIYLILRNTDRSPTYFSVDVEEPLIIIDARTVPTDLTDIKNLVLQRDECLQVMISCRFTNEDLLAYADFIYQHDETEGTDKTEEFTSVIKKHFNVYQQGTTRQLIQFQMRLHFPHIVVKPHFIKFGHSLNYRTRKTIFTIYNMTASIVKFEIFKSNKNEDFEVHPNHGEIARSTGANNQFVDVTVYFTPIHCKLYMESLRILTNIPQYYIDVPVAGHGSNDEKFNVD